MKNKILLYLFLGLVFLKADNIECNNPTAIETLKKEFPDIFFKNAYDISGLKGYGVDYESYARKKDDIVKLAQMHIHIDSISDFQKIIDSCSAFINASISAGNETNKGVWAVMYKIKEDGKIEIEDYWYQGGYMYPPPPMW